MNSNLKEFVKYTIFNVLGMIGLSCYILADTFFISFGIGANGLTALNLALPVYSAINGCGLMLGIGGATKYAIMKSQGKKDCNDSFSNTVIMAVVFGIIFFLIGTFLSEKIALLLGADKYVYHMTSIYLKVLLMFGPVFLLNNVMNAFVRNDGNPRLSMIAMLVGSFGNIILDYLFVIKFKMGMFGAVLATGFSPIMGLIVLSGHFDLFRRNSKKKLIANKCEYENNRQSENDITTDSHIKFKMAKIRASFIKSIIMLGIPSFVTEMSSGIVILVFNIIILGLQGNVGVAAYGVIANLALVVVSIFTGVAQGSQPLFSAAYGKNDKKMQKQLFKYAITAVTLISIVIYAVILLFANPITSIFNGEGNMQLQAIAVKGMYLYFTSILFIGMNIVMATYFAAREKVIPSYIISFGRGFVVIIPMAFIMSFIWKMTGVWLAMTVTEGMITVLGVGMYLFSNKNKL